MTYRSAYGLIKYKHTPSWIEVNSLVQQILPMKELNDFLFSSLLIANTKSMHTKNYGNQKKENTVEEIKKQPSVINKNRL